MDKDCYFGKFSLEEKKKKKGECGNNIYVYLYVELQGGD